MNFAALEKDLEDAIAADQKYERENSAKFRAVEQKVATYDEFREIVRASHLTPLEKKEKLVDPNLARKNVLGPKNDVVQEIIFQLSQIFKSEIIFCQDLNHNFSEKSKPKKKSQKSQIISSHEPITSQEVISKLRTRIQNTFGFVDILVVLQNSEPAKDNTHSFLNNLNKQLLVQFWIVMAFLPGMLRRNKGLILSVALGKSSLINTGIMRTVHEELLLCNTNVKLTLVESNTIFENHYLPPLSSDVLASLIVRSMWSSSSVVKIPSLPCYLVILPVLFIRFLLKPLGGIFNFVSLRNF